MKKENHQKPEDEDEFARFVKKAKEIQAEDAEEKFEDALRRILPAKSKELPESEP